MSLSEHMFVILCLYEAERAHLDGISAKHTMMESQLCQWQNACDGDVIMDTCLQTGRGTLCAHLMSSRQDNAVHIMHVFNILH